MNDIWRHRLLPLEAQDILKDIRMPIDKRIAKVKIWFPKFFIDGEKYVQQMEQKENHVRAVNRRNARMRYDRTKATGDNG